MRVTHTVDVSISEDADGKVKVFGPDAGSGLIQQIDAFAQHTSGTFNVTDHTTGEALSLGDITSPAVGIYIRSSTGFNLKLNGGSEVISVRKADANTLRLAKFFVEGPFTAVQVLAIDAATPAAGSYVMWGAAGWTAP